MNDDGPEGVEPADAELPPEQPPDQAGWLCDALQIPPEDWTAIATVVRALPSFEVQSCLLALEHLPGQFARAAFEQGFPTSIRAAEIRSGDDGTESAAVVGTHVAVEVYGLPAVVWIESDIGQHASELRLVGAAESREQAALALDRVADSINEHTTWRRRPVVLDPTPDGILRALSPVPVHEPPPVVVDELTRSIIDPLRAGGDAGGARLLITGPPGSGKSSIAEWVAQELRDQATVSFVPPRVIASADLVHLAFEVASASRPALLVFDHVDLILGDRYSMRFPESLAELVTKLGDADTTRGTAVLALATSGEALDPVLLERLGRRIELGAAPPAELDARLRALVDKYADGDVGTLETLRSRSRGWVLGVLAELERVVELTAAEGEPVDLARLSARVGSPIVAGEASGEGGNYL